MNTCIHRKQSGITLFGLVVILMIAGAAGILALKVVPIYSEYKSVVRAVKVASEDAKTPKEARDSFDAQASAGYISSLSGKDLEITRAANGVNISFSYQRKIHLVGPASLLFEFSGSTEDGKL